MAWPTVHRTGSQRLMADKTGFDPRHRVSSVIFESFLAPYSPPELWACVLHVVLPKTILFTTTTPPLGKSSTPNSTLGNLRTTSRLNILGSPFDTRNEFQSSTYLNRAVRDRGNFNPARLRYPPILTGRCAMRLRYPLIYNRTGGTLSDGNA